MPLGIVVMPCGKVRTIVFEVVAAVAACRPEALRKRGGHMPHVRLALSSVLAVCVLTVGLAAQMPAVQYVYDDLGRLVEVIDNVGNSAIYRYDSVGNIVAITSYTAGAVAIAHFTPSVSPVGATVTIYGTGFSATSAQDTVTFNGVGAAVQSATPTMLVVIVPPNATSGPISVTAPNGTAVSNTAFTVGPTGGGGPTITNVTPALAGAGGTVTISGANFDPVAARNRVLIDGSEMQVTSAAVGTLTATVPSVAGSGHVTVGTAFGTAVSASDLFVLPNTYNVVDVDTAVRMAIGDTRTVSTTHTGGVAVVIFDAVAGQHVSQTVTGAQATAQLWGPDQSELAAAGGTSDTNLFLHAVVPRTATYLLTIQPVNTSSATVSVTIGTVPANITGTITPDGTPVTVTITAQGQSALLTFSDTAGARVSAVITNQTMTGSSVRFLNSDGTFLSNWSFVTGSSGFVEPIALWQTGTQKLLFVTSWVGSATLALYSVPPDLSGNLTVGGSPSVETFTTPGQNGSWTFAGTANQQITVRVTSNTIGNVLVNLRKPDGTSLTSTISNAANFNLATQTLPVTGTYSVVVDPSGANTGSLNLQVTNP